MYSIEIYNKKTGEPICYVRDTITFTNDINRVFVYDENIGLDNFSDGLISMIYKKHTPGTMSEHEYTHIKEDYFNNIKKKDVGFRIFNKVQEIRKKKINKIKKED
jgi:hypothetical protein